MDSHLEAHARVAVGEQISIDGPRLVAMFTPLRSGPGPLPARLEYGRA